MKFFSQCFILSKAAAHVGFKPKVVISIYFKSEYQTYTLCLNHLQEKKSEASEEEEAVSTPPSSDGEKEASGGSDNEEEEEEEMDEDA